MADFQFLYPSWLFAAIPALLLSLWLYRHSNRSHLIAHHLSQQLGLDKKQSYRPMVTVLLSAWLVAVIALAGPSFDKQEVPSFGVNNSRVIVMDMTLSMYATDLAPNRLTQARYKVMDLLSSLNEGSTGLVAYSADGYMISPLTHDANTLRSLIPNLSPDIMPTRGSNAGAGVKKAIDMLTQAGHLKGDIILVADGLSASESKSIEELLNGTNWRLSVMSVGTRQGAPIRLPNGDMFTHNGSTIVAKTDTQTLRSIAQIGHGVYTPLRSDDVDIQTLSKVTNQVPLTPQKKTTGTPELEIHINHGFWLLPILLILALGAFRRGGIFSLALLVSLPLLQPQNAFAAPVTQTSESKILSAFKTADQLGYQSYQAKDYTKAATQFNDPAWQGAAHYQSGNYQAAIQSLQGLTDEDSRYNLANALAQSGQLEQAKEAYEAILKSNPTHEDAKHNLEIVNQALQQQQQEQQQNKQSQDQDKNQQQDEQEQKQSQSNQQPDNKQQQGQQDQDAQSDSDQGSPSQNEQSHTDQKDKRNGQDDQTQSKQSNQSDNDSQAGNESEPETQNKPNQAQADKSQQNEEQEQLQTLATNQQEDTNSDQTSNTVEVDPRLSKLEQIPDDAQRLLQAQMALEAQQSPKPESNGQQW